MFVVSRLIQPASDSTAAGRRRGGGGAVLLEGWVPLAVAAACGVGLVFLCTVLAVLACVTRRRRRRRRRQDCTKHHQNADAAAALPLTGGKYNCRVETLKVVSVCDNSNG